MTRDQQTMACRSNPVHQLFLYGQQAKKSFYFSMVEKTQKSNKQYFITCENYETLVSVCTSQGFWGRGLADLLMYYLGLHSLQQQTWIAATETLCGLQSSEHQLAVHRKSLLPRGLQQWWLQCVVQTSPTGFQKSLCGLVCETGLEVYFLCLVFYKQLLKWMWVAGSDSICSKVEAQPSAGHAGDSEISEIKLLLHVPTSTHPCPPKTCIITMVFSSIPACKQIAGWEINTIVWSGIALFLERLDNKYFRLAGHIISAAITQHCHVTRKQPGTT